jgi:hypothetical protein
MAAALNQANKAYAEQKAAEEAAKKQNEAQKKEDLQEILDMFSAWMGEYYDIEEDLPADQVIELIDSLKEYIDAFKNLETMFSVKNATKPAVKVIKSNTKPANADETINAFLKKMGW